MPTSPRQFIQVNDLDDDAIVDGVKGKVRFENVISGSGAPTVPPAVPEKDWVYLNKAEDPAVPYFWDSAAEEWKSVAGASTGGETVRFGNETVMALFPGLASPSSLTAALASLVGGGGYGPNPVALIVDTTNPSD